MNPGAAVLSYWSSFSYVANEKSYRLFGDFRPTAVAVPLCSFTRTVPVTCRWVDCT